MLQSERQVVTNPAVGHGAWLLFSGFLLSFVIFFFLVGRFHLANSTGPHVLGCKLAAFTGAHTFSVSMQLTLMNLMYWIFFFSSNSILNSIHVHYSQVSDQDFASNLFYVASYIVQVLLLATDLLPDTQSSGLCKKDTPYKSTSQSDTKSLPESKAQGTSSALPKRHCSILQTETILALCFYFRFCLQLKFFLQLVFPWGWRNAAADVWFNMKYVALVTKYIYIYVHIYIYIYMYICIFINIFIHIHIYIHIYIYIHIHTHTHTYKHTYTHIHTHTYAHTYTQTHTHTHIYIYIVPFADRRSVVHRHPFQPDFLRFYVSDEVRKTSVADEIFAWDRTVSRLMESWHPTWCGEIGETQQRLILSGRVMCSNSPGKLWGCTQWSTESLLPFIDSFFGGGLSNWVQQIQRKVPS